MRILLSLCALLCCVESYSQKFTISGTVKDADTGESLIGATITETKTVQGNIANTHGFYSLTLPRDSVTLMYSYVGYTRKIVSLSLTRDTVINMTLQSAMLDEVVVNTSRAEAIHESTRMSTFSIPIEQIKSLPAFLGETDILKVLQLMPGVQSGNEGSTGLYVRGGGPDQNLLLLDGVPIYNASHLFGFFSVFNADAINHVELTKGGFPARYGGRLSSVIDINMKEGDMKKFKGEGAIGVISSKLTLDGPIVKDKTSFIVSARRTYIDILSKPFLAAQRKKGDDFGYYFYDLNLKLNHIFNSNNRVYLSTYTGKDKAYAKETYKNYNGVGENVGQYSLLWGNVITALRWNHIFGPRLFSNASATYSRYNFSVRDKQTEESQLPDLTLQTKIYRNDYSSNIRDWSAGIDFDYLPSPEHTIRFGARTTLHKFVPGVYTSSDPIASDTVIGAHPVNASEFSAYAEDDWILNDRIKVNAGVHTSAFYVENKWYHSIQPRLSVRYLIQPELALKASYSKMAQYIHLLTNAGIGLPTDLWVSSTARIKPQRSDQYAAGIAKTIKSEYEFSVEGYYKKMENLIEYKDGASYLNIETDWQDNVATNGHGKSYGLEVLLQKKTGKVSGWLGYTLSKSTRQFDELNFGKEFPYKFDRRHDLSLALSYNWNKRRDFSFVWVYGSGNKITLPTAEYESIGSSDPYSYNRGITYYGDRNSYSMRAYHRLDVSFSWIKEKKWGERKWTLGIYNVYNRLNPFFIDIGSNDQGQAKFIEYSLFPILPSFSYSFKF